MNVRAKGMLPVMMGAIMAISTTSGFAQATAKPATGTPTQTKPAPAKPAATTPATQKPAAQKPTTAKPTTAKPATAKPAAPSAALRTPAKLKDVAPATFRASFDTSVGVFVIEVTRAWAPKGADRFYNLVKYGYFDGNRFFRVVRNFMVQFGINGDPKLNAVWSDADIIDDPVTQSNKRGFVTFAKTSAPNSRSTQIFINFKDNSFLDPQVFAPFGQVVTGMEVVDKLNGEYGEQPSQMQGQIQSGGNAYLAKAFPRLDYIKKASIEKMPPPPPPPPKK
jgi:peptidyl-prolyl cis-trans isomerase A (cyclophilin A)